MMNSLEKGLPDATRDIAFSLRAANDEYAELYKKCLELGNQYPFITRALEDSGTVSMTVDEHERMLEYLDAKFRMEDMERIQLYYTGHRDCFVYLQKIGLI
jgi:hypothetical protein